MKDGKHPNTIHPITGYDKEIYVKPTITNPNIIVGDFTYIADLDFESHVSQTVDCGYSSPDSLPPSLMPAHCAEFAASTRDPCVDVIYACIIVFCDLRGLIALQLQLNGFHTFSSNAIVFLLTCSKFIHIRVF